MDPHRSIPGWPCSIPSPHYHHHHHCHHHHCHHHHHHHHHQLFFCPHTQLRHHHCHRHVRPNFAPFPPNAEPAPSPAFFPQDSIVAASSGLGEPSGDSAAAHVAPDQYYGTEDEEGEEPVFVLTDEWRDFFAKSEAKRKLGKKRAKKGKK